MKKFIVMSAFFMLLPVFAGESVGLLLNFEESIKNISLAKGITSVSRDAVMRSLESMKTYIEHSDSKLVQKFLPIESATKVLCNVVQIAFNKFIVPFKKEVEDNPFENADPKRTIGGIEETIKPLHSELKKIKGSFLSGFSLKKKSEAQKVVDGARDALVDKIQEILKNFEVIKKSKIIN